MAGNDNYIVELKLVTSLHQFSVLEKRFAIAENIYNKTLKHAKTQLKKMKENKDYKKALSAYIVYKKALDKKNIKVYADILNSITRSYSLSEYDFHKFVKMQQNLYKAHIDSNTAQKIASSVWKATADVLYGKGRKLHFKKYGQLNSVEGKANTSGIRFIENELHWNKLVIPVKMRQNDLFVQESLQNKVKYCRIVRKPFHSGNKYFLQLIIGGIPPTKRVNSTGAFRGKASPHERVGLDIGTATLAMCSSIEVDLMELAPKSKQYDAKINRLKRKLQRSRQAMNPENFNPNGTIKRGVKLTWIRSRRYLKTLYEIKNAYRMKATYMKHSHNKLCSRILSLGNQVYVEAMSFSGLSKRAKETTVNKKGKFNRKGRFGKSIGNKAPAMLLSILDRKLAYQGLKLHKVNTWTFRASQYNHVTDAYDKKSLSTRWNNIQEEPIQRDLYSAFLLMNSNNSLEATDKALCLATYVNFKLSHDHCVNTLKKATPN